MDELQKINLTSLYFDGKQDITRFHRKGAKCLQKEEHITLISEPGTKFIGHITPKTGSASDITTAMMTYFNENQISVENLRVGKFTHGVFTYGTPTFASTCSCFLCFQLVQMEQM